MRSLLNRALLSLALGHFIVDVNANLLPVMLPYVKESMALTYSQTALIVTCFSLSSSMTQPLFGFLADRFGGRRLLVAPIVWMVLLMGLAGSAPSYFLLVAIVTLAGFGSAAYHPQGAANARNLGGRNVATAVSVFSLGGIAGYSLGPMLAAAAFGVFGPKGTAAFVPFGLLLAVVIALSVKDLGRVTQVQAHAASQSGKAAVPVVLLGTLLFVVMSRGWIEAAIVAYTPLRFSGQLVYSSQLLFVFLFSEALGTFLGAVAADRFGRRRVIAATCFLLAPAVFLYNGSTGPGLFLAAAVGGLLLGSSVPVTIVMAQELLPRSVGVASGLMMGFAFGMAGLGVAINGVVADHYGLATSLSLIVAVPVLAGLVALTFPATMEARRAPAPEPIKPAAEAAG